jgi:hypothetical protein
MSYNDVGCSMKVSATVLRGYLGKVSKKVRVSSRNPTYSHRSNSGTHCRETCASNIRDGIIKPAESVGTKDYYVLPVASLVNKSGTVFNGTSKISMSIPIKNKIDRQDYKDALNYTLGIIGVLFCSDESEARRRRRKVGLASDVDVSFENGGLSSYVNVEYEVLSPLWLITPVTVSFVLGVTKNMLSITTYNNDLLHRKLLSKASRSEIESIINNCDRVAAGRIYRKVIIPFFNDSSICGNSNVHLSKDNVRNTISPLIKDGIKHHLNPEKTKNYWKILDSHYGISEYNANRDSWEKINSRTR